MDHSYSMEAQGVNCQRHLSYSIINRLEAIELRSSLSDEDDGVRGKAQATAASPGAARESVVLISGDGHHCGC